MKRNFDKMLSRRGTAIRLDSLSEIELNGLKQQLTVTPEVNKDYGFTTSYAVYQVTKNYILVPRNFYNVPNTLAEGDGIQVPFTGKLKETTNQIEAATSVIGGLRSQGSGILSLPTGYGKTTVALYVLSKMSVKTLVVVHKEFLMTQWEERIMQFLPNARVGRLQANVVDVEDKDIVIAMLQSLSKKDYDTSVFNGFGLTIIDETHHVCTRSFSKMFTKINTKYLLGLSATLDRKDGLTHVLHWYLGSVLYKIERKQQKQVKVNKADFKCEDYSKPFPTNRLKKPSLPEAITIITENEKRNEFILETINECLSQGRKVLVLTDRRQHCMTLLEQLHSDFTKGLYIGGMKPGELKLSEECDVIFATYSLAHEGLDIPALDTLIMASPKSDIVQSVGRILRETTGKVNTPYIVDIVDAWGPFQYQYFKRTKYYKSAGFSVSSEAPSEAPSEAAGIVSLGYAFIEE
jgi:superfamily II DNA or RNA helicase